MGRAGLCTIPDRQPHPASNAHELSPESMTPTAVMNRKGANISPLLTLIKGLLFMQTFDSFL
jgi:hypothetical protein